MLWCCIIKLLIAIGGLFVLGLAYWLISPLFITERVDEKINDIMALPSGSPTATEAPMAPEIVSQGEFAGLAGHSGRGTAKLLFANGKHYIRLEDNFRVTNGPDLFVYFGKNGSYVSEARIAALKGNEGGQNYEVPSDIDPSQFSEVWIWCRAFSIPFAKTELR